MYVYSPACGDVASGVVVEVGGWGVKGAGRERRLESGPKGWGSKLGSSLVARVL